MDHAKHREILRAERARHDLELGERVAAITKMKRVKL